MYDAWAATFPRCAPVLDGLQRNLRHWQADAAERRTAERDASLLACHEDADAGARGSK